jgi:hypothetical protein
VACCVPAANSDDAAFASWSRGGRRSSASLSSSSSSFLVDVEQLPHAQAAGPPGALRPPDDLRLGAALSCVSRRPSRWCLDSCRAYKDIQPLGESCSKRL